MCHVFFLCLFWFLYITYRYICSNTVGFVIDTHCYSWYICPYVTVGSSYRIFWTNSLVIQYSNSSGIWNFFNTKKNNRTLTQYYYLIICDSILIEITQNLEVFEQSWSSTFHLEVWTHDSWSDGQNLEIVPSRINSTCKIIQFNRT